MADEKVAIPMFEAFLAQVRPPDLKLWSVKLDKAFLITIGVVGLILPPHGLVAGVLVIATIQIRKGQRARLVGSKPPAFRVAYGKWEKVQPLVKLTKDHRLRRRVPATVLLALEQAARSWHDAKTAVDELALRDADASVEAETEIESSMMAAAAAAAPCVLRDDQSRKEIERMEADADLMRRVCGRIEDEELRLRLLAEALNSTRRQAPGALHDRLRAARTEREIAEAELDAIVLSNASATE